MISESFAADEENELKLNRVSELKLNVDDMTAEEIGFAMEKIYEAGAVECFTTAVGMKKCRPGTLITILCREDKKEAVLLAAFRHTNTIGIRENICRRYTLNRKFETVENELGSVRKKISEGFGIRREKLEYDDLARIANEYGMSISEVRKIFETDGD